MKTITPPSNVVHFEIPANTPCNRLLDYTDLNLRGNPANTRDNLAFLVESMGITLAQNQMNLELEMLKDGAAIDESFESKRSMLISEAAKTGLPKSAIDDHMTALCERNAYHPVRAWLENGDQWDGVERVKHVIACLNAKKPELAQIAFSKWFVAAIAALYEPHFDCKIIPVLHSGQKNFMKTTFISRIAEVVPNAFVEGAELNPDNKDSTLKVIKGWIVEAGELERTSRNSQGSIKAFVTLKVDSVRPPYARTDIKKKRQTVFIATVNGTDFLRDETGSSRYYVIELEKIIDIEKLNELLGYSYEVGRLTHDKPELLRQFWLEVKHMYDNGASWVVSGEELDMFSETNKKHQFKDDMRYLLEDTFLDKNPKTNTFRWMKASEVCDLLKLPSSKARQVGRALKAMEADGQIQAKEGRSRIMNYYLPYAFKVSEEK